MKMEMNVRKTIYVVIENISGVSYTGNEYYTTRELAEAQRRSCIYENGSVFSEEEMKDIASEDWIPKQDTEDFLYNPDLDQYYSTSTDDYDCVIDCLVCGD